MAQIPTADENLQISSRILNIKNRSIENKGIMSDFLESYIIDNDNNHSINDFLVYNIWQMESPFLSSMTYTYWVAGGLSWNNWFNNDNDFLDEEKISMTTGNFEFNYLYINDAIFDKIKALYNLTLKLKELLASKGINTKIITTNFEVDVINIEGQPPVFDFKFNKVNNALFKEPFFNIKLVLDLGVRGGSRPPKKSRGSVRFSFLVNKKKHHREMKNKSQSILFLREMAKLMTLKKKFTEEQKNKLISTIDVYNEKTIVEFQLNLFENDPKNPNVFFNINEFNNAYILKPKIAGTFNPQIDNIITMRLKLNILNEIGLITYSYLTTTNRFSEMGLNVDLYRQKMFMKKQLGNNRELIVPYFEKLLNIYKQLFNNRKSYNTFFIEKIEEIINSYSSFYYSEFIDFIDKWFISKFRSAINSFIKEINADLEKFNVKLFVAGGDAMRRYDTDISFSKDIDTKLYIGNASSPSGITLNPAEIKQAIIDIILTHVVKLRNYLQEKYKSLFSESCISIDKKIIYKTDTKIFQLYLSLDDKKYHQFRVREIKKSDLFPVDLYSIDFNTKIIEYDILTKKETIKFHTISLLDVVLQDNDNLYPYYYKIFDNIPVASLKFLVEDFIKTYTTDDRALARIASGKVHKDIKRYERLFDLYNKEKEGTLPPANPSLILSDEDIDIILANINSVLPKKHHEIETILTKIKERSEFDICDLITIIEMLKNQTIVSNLNPQILTIFKDLAFFNKNLYFEQLNKSDADYHSYDYTTGSDNIAKIYLELFRAMCNNNDGLQKHSMSYSIFKIKNDYRNLLNKDLKQSSYKTTAKPLVAKTTGRIKDKPIDKSKAKSRGIIQTTRSGRISKMINQYKP